MYNTRRSINNSPGNNQYNARHQQLPQRMPHVATYITPPAAANQAQAMYQSQQQSVKNMGPILQPQIQIPVQPLVPVSKPMPDNQSQASNVVKVVELNVVKKDDDQPDEDVKVEKFKFPKRKINKKEQKKRLNARMRRLVCPKSPLMVFSELYKDVTIKLEETPHDNGMIYTASFTVDGQLYSGKHHAKTQAKQRACENFLRVLLAKKMNEQPEKKENFIDIKVEDSDTLKTIPKPKGPPQEDFPWPHFASLAMHNLINHWELQPVSKVVPEEAVKVASKSGSMKKFPENPENYNPVQLLHQMTPGLQFTERTLSISNPSLFEVFCEVDSVTYKGQGTTKKAAKKECAISAIKHLWNFDFHSVAVK